jgi:hypothetical protein
MIRPSGDPVPDGRVVVRFDFGTWRAPLGRTAEGMAFRRPSWSDDFSVPSSSKQREERVVLPTST